MDAIIRLSNQLGEIPSSAHVAAVLGVGNASHLNGLAIQLLDGTEYYQAVPAGSRAWLRVLFPRLAWRAEPVLNEDFTVYTFRFSTFEDALVAKTRSRELAAKALGILR